MTDGQSATLSWCEAPFWSPSSNFYYCQRVAGSLTKGALSDERIGQSFTIAADSRQRSHSRVRVPLDSLRFETPPTWRARSPYLYHPREQGGPVTPTGIGLPFRRLQRLSVLRWEYSKPSPRGVLVRALLHIFAWWWLSKGAGIAQSVERLATGWTIEGSEFESR
jgi:hypothetical protein